MPPKKRDKEAESVKNPRVEQIQADHESFLQAFESKFSFSKFNFNVLFMFIYYH